MSQTFELTLTAMAHGGAALGRHEGRVIFVPYALPGETIRARITEDRKSYAFAEVVKILNPSPDRVDPLCPHFGPSLCGGCQWQHIAYNRQLEAKRNVVVDQLQRIGGFDDPLVHPTLPSPEQWRYRYHSTFTVREDGRLGLVSDDNSQVVAIEECHILLPTLHELFARLERGDDLITRIKFQAGSDPQDRMLILETAADEVPGITVDEPISINLLLEDNEPVNLIGSPRVTYQIHDRAFQVTAGSFFQVNPPVAGRLVDLVLDRLDLQGSEMVLDLFSGVGLFSAFIARHADYVISAESYPPAVSDAEINLVDLDNIDLVEGPVEAVLEDLEGPFEAVVLDPPRAGLDVTVIDELARLASPLIVYVSCDPASLARDLKRLVRHDYRLVDVQPVDMFPQTYHIEAVATLRLG